MGRLRTTVGLAGVALLAGSVVAVAPSTAQTDETTTTTSSTVPATTTTTTAPPPPQTVVVPTVPTTTPAQPLPPPPPGTDVDSPPGEPAPPAVDVPPPPVPPPVPPAPPAALVRSIKRQLGAARKEADAAKAVLAAATRQVRGLEAVVRDYEAQLQSLQGEEARAAERLGRARDHMERQAVAAYTGGRLDTINLMVEAHDINDLVRRLHLVEATLDATQRVLAEYRAARKAAGERVQAMFAQVQAVRNELVRVQADEAAKADVAARAQALVDSLRAGSLVAVRGFVFPVAGPRRFSNDWGAPRMIGTPYAHAHQGNDIFAGHGTPLVAVERGVVTRIGTDTLGGTKLWLVGETGHRYYYAHLSAYQPGVIEGLVVGAGQVLAYVGNTGNAVGTPPHVHFEIHPPGAGPVNPYPLLKAVDTATGGWRPTTTTAAAPASAPAPGAPGAPGAARPAR